MGERCVPVRRENVRTSARCAHQAMAWRDLLGFGHGQAAELDHGALSLGARIPGFVAGPGDRGKARGNDRDRLPAAIGVRTCDAVCRSADADPVLGHSVLLPGSGSAPVLGNSVRMVCRQGCRTGLARRTDRARHRRHRAPSGGDDHRYLRGRFTLGRSRPSSYSCVAGSPPCSSGRVS